jgi:hypothetical protein
MQFSLISGVTIVSAYPLVYLTVNTFHLRFAHSTRKVHARMVAAADMTMSKFLVTPQCHHHPQHQVLQDVSHLLLFNF